MLQFTQNCSIFLYFQGKITVLISGEIHCLCLERNPFAGIIPEFAAGILFGTNPALAADHGALFQLCSMHTVGAGTLYFFPKQHMTILQSFLPVLYNSGFQKATLFFALPESKQENRHPNRKKIKEFPYENQRQKHGG